MNSPSQSRSQRKPSFGVLASPVLASPGLSSMTPLSGGGGGIESQIRSRRSSSMKRIDLGRLGSMHALTPLSKAIKEMSIKGPLNIMFIGAGNINFGSDEGPWNHSVRLEHKLQTRLNVVAIIDPASARAQAVFDMKCASFVERAYKNARLCKNLDEFIATMKPEEKPDAIVIGSPAQFHGSNIPGQDLELQCLKYFPEASLFIEKPISCAPIHATYALADELEKRGTVASVGYMLRYLQAIQHMQRIITEAGKPVMMVVARYIASYAKIKSEVWWDKSKSLGPVVEQGTHLVDLCRYFGGDAILDTVQATSTEHFEEAGALEAIPIDEGKIPPEHRNPRTTSALWKFEGGAVCSFVHTLTLQGQKYSTELEVLLDGWSLRVNDLYNEPTLYVRSPESDAEQKIDFPQDDPYYGEISAWIDAHEAKKSGIRPAAAHSESAIADDDESSLFGDENGILSSFRDACGTYALTHAIKEASERAMKTIAVV